jgi:orotate phosphoribosyltransferase
MWILLSSGRTSQLVFDRTQNNQALHVDAAGGAGRSSEIVRRISANRILGMATSAIWKAT